MKKFTIICLGLSFAASLMAFDSDYYGNNYSGSWQYPTTYSNTACEPSMRPAVKRVMPQPDFRPLVKRAMPKPESRPLIKRVMAQPVSRPSASGPLEQRAANLIVMFTMEQCPFCAYLKPIIQQAERKFGKDVKFLYVDINQNPQYPAQYGFSVVPQIFYFKNGKKMDSHGSANKTMTIGQVEQKITNFFGDN